MLGLGSLVVWVMLAPSLRRHKCIRGLCFRHTKSPCSHHEPPHPISLAALSLCTGLCSLCHPTAPPVPSPAPPCSLDTPLTATSTDPFAGATPQCTPLPPLGHPHPFFSFQKVSSPPSSGKKSPFAREAPCYASRLPAHCQFQNPPPHYHPLLWVGWEEPSHPAVPVPWHCVAAGAGGKHSTDTAVGATLGPGEPRVRNACLCSRTFWG